MDDTFGACDLNANVFKKGTNIEQLKLPKK